LLRPCCRVSQRHPRPRSVCPLLWPETPCKMRAFDEETNMRIDGLARPKFISAEAFQRQDVGWTPRWLARYFAAGRLGKSRQRSAASKLGAIGQLEVSLTRDKRDVKRLQKLRYQVFYENGRGVADRATWFMRRDYFDNICDHLMVVDRSRSCEPKVSAKP
jgi:hypothetical protein